MDRGGAARATNRLPPAPRPPSLGIVYFANDVDVRAAQAAADAHAREPPRTADHLYVRLVARAAWGEETEVGGVEPLPKEASVEGDRACSETRPLAVKTALVAKMEM